ncbi:endonuclease [Sulfitobacter sp. LCG007]
MMDDMDDCRRKSWMLAAGLALLVFLVLWIFSGWGFFGALLTGIVVMLLLGLLLANLRCKDNTVTQAAPSPAPRAQPAPQPAAATPAPRTGKAEAGKAETAAAPAPEPAVEPAPVAEPIAEAASAPEPVSQPEPTPGHATAAAADAAKEEREPALMQSPKGGSEDDLKLISGVGPKLEETLNGLGIWHFDQIAAWDASEVAWVDSRLRFKGRIERDDWIGQAKTLAAGGETEFSRRKKRG